MSSASNNKLISELIRGHLQSAEKLRSAVTANEAFSGAVQQLGQAIADSFGAGGKLLIFGNGGSASQAQHLAVELCGRYLRERPPLPAIALTPDAAVVTALGNDFGFEAVFERQVMALARPGDVVLGLTTSGTSPNVLAGLRAAAAQGAVTALMVGQPKRPLPQPFDIVVTVPSSDTQRVQEVHLLVIHILCDIVETLLYPENS